jgi:predicted nucleic acid-binding protein
MRYLLDSTGLIDWLKGRPGAARTLEELAIENVLAVNAVSVAEVYAGIKDKDLPMTDRLFAGFDYWQIDHLTARLAGTYRYEYARRGLSMSITDMLLAAHAVNMDATLVTGNLRHFPMPELNVLPLSSG